MEWCIEKTRNIIAILTKIKNDNKTLYHNLDSKGKILIYIPIILVIGMIIFSPIINRIDKSIINQQENSTLKPYLIERDKIIVFNIILLSTCFVIVNYYSILHQISIGFMLNWQIIGVELVLMSLKMKRLTLNIDIFIITFIATLFALNIALRKYFIEQSIIIYSPFQTTFENIHLTQQSYLLFSFFHYTLSLVLLNFVHLPNIFLSIIIKLGIIGILVISSYKFNKYSLYLISSSVLVIIGMSYITNPWTITLPSFLIICFYVYLSFVIDKHIVNVINNIQTLSVQAFHESTLAPFCDNDNEIFIQIKTES
ncbi:hypothetical protein EDI_199730 [Entamoeba dispar SAW760]|uniref:Uncharacterized protein n=1 Tax=Entamoeba dispar (strain ATCC PRA-260 / SAW760) TaxID=370354 RepID=B0EC31_ENTDS|nr:uncharacterized protein EDI_199730 [Entamoeba dispar SAW760]EDR27921.1 hypothetical protein EDI_199730 [Entamoeba dispar SAW760]|eukprot:EDR27921.1 hypothetical protein EDI_199730 [Entamoeba dispar SAW760]